MAEDIYGDTVQKVNNSTAVNRMKNLFESPTNKTSKGSASSIATFGSNSKSSHSTISNGNVPLLPAKEKSRTYLNAENSKSLSSIGSRAWTSSSPQSRSSILQSSCSGLSKTDKEPAFKSDSVNNNSKSFLSKMDTDNIPPWKKELMEKRKKQEEQKQQNGVVGNNSQTQEEKKPPNVTPSKFTGSSPGVVKPSNITLPKNDEKDVNSNSITSPVEGKKRDSKLEIPNIFKKEEDTAIKPVKPIKPKPQITPRKPTTELTSPTNNDVGTKFTPGKVRLPSESTSIQDELAAKLAKRKQTDSESNDTSSPEVTVNKLNKNSIDLLQKKLTGQQDKSEDKKEDDSPVVLRTNFEGGNKITPKRKSVIRKSLTRHVDGQKFYIVDIEKTKTFVKAPPLPDKLEITDLQKLQEIIRDYKAALAELEGVAEDLSGGGVTEEADEIYEDIPADMDEEFPPPPSEEKVLTRPCLSRNSRAVSLIKPMSEDEEDDEIYDDTDLPPPPDELLKPPVPEAPRPAVPTRKQPPPPPPKSPVPSERDATEETEDVYDDTAVENQNDQEIYEPIMGEEDESNSSKSSEQLQESDKPAAETPQDKKKKEREEKERKKAEKKKQEEEKKKQLEEKKQLKNLKKTFNIEPFELDNIQGEGTLKADTPTKAGKNDIVAKAGQHIKIVRMINNPKGKWLVKLSDNGKVGYIDSNNVEVENQLIRNVMEGSYMNTLHNDDDGEDYVDCEVGEAPVAEELYEAV